MQLRLKTKITLTTALLVLGVVALISLLYVATLTREVIREADNSGRFLAQMVFLQAQHALADAAREGAAPASENPADVHEYVRKALDENDGLTSLIDAAVGYSPTIYEVTIIDRDGTALVSSDASLPGRPVLRAANLKELANSNFLEQLRVLYGPPRVYEVSFPFKLGAEPFGEIRIGLQTGLMRAALLPSRRSAGLLVLGALAFSTLLAAAVSHVSLAPLAQISAQLDRISAGEFDQRPIERGDEFGQVSTKISQIGQQLRGVHEIFSTLRENLNQIMAGLEDGLLLFTRDGRAVMVSPAVEKFLGAPADQLLGRRAAEIFPLEHPLRQALRFEGDVPQPVAAAEVELDGADGARRVGLSVQAITEGGTRMGALVTLRDLESLERIGTQLRVSERLAALGRVTAGIAHEVKNPLNSMRLWLENLKESLPSDQELSQQAVKVLDNEIDRLDRVVKRFLDFTRPVELHLEETNLAELLAEIVATARPQFEKARVEAVTHLPGDIPPVNLDRQLIKQAILNLVLNAVEAMPNGGRLSVTLERRGEMAEVSVADTGAGIAPEHRARIFQLFFTTRPGGSGIGLASTFRIVQLHNGSIDFDSEAGRGTTFRVELPLAGSLGLPRRARDT
jgi:PAS domain S-box-containing protein